MCPSPRRIQPLLLLAGLLLAATNAPAATTVTLGWNPNPAGEDVAGYVLYWGTVSRENPQFTAFEHQQDVGPALQWPVDLPAEATRCYFSVAAYNAAGQFSAPSVELSTFAVNAIAGPGGVIEPAGTIVVEGGTSLQFRVLPGEGYAPEELRVDNVAVGTPATYVLEAIGGPHQLYAAFTPVSPPPPAAFQVTFSAGPHGSLVPGGTVEVDPGGSLTFTVVPDAHYLIADVLVNGTSLGAVTAHTLQNVTGNVAVSATFIKETRVINVSSGKGGSVNHGPKRSAARTAAAEVAPADYDVTVEYGGSAAFTIEPDTGYAIENVLVDGASVGSVDYYEFVNVTGNARISASFLLLDADHDGMPDDWERRYFSDVSADPQGDLDGDGITNYAEYLNGTDPTVPDVDPTLTPTLAGPVSGATVTDRTPEVSVYNPLNPGGVALTYQFQVATDAKMTSVVASAQGVEPGQGMTGWAPGTPLQNRTRYYWRARTRAEAVSSEWTPVSTFLLDTNGLATVAEVVAAEYALPDADTAVTVDDSTNPLYGVGVELSSGTLSEEFVVTVAAVTNPPLPEAGSDTRVLGRVVELGPHGRPFSQPVTILLPYTDQNLSDAGVTEPSDLNVLTYNADTLAWERVPSVTTDYLARRLIARVNHFSMYAVGVAPEAPAPEPPAESGGGGGGGGGGCFIGSLR